MARFEAKKSRNGLVAIAIATPLLVACNAILGISDYQKQECNGGVCATPPPDGGPDTGPTDASNDNNVPLLDAQGADPVAWAHFKMPNYPQEGDAAPDKNPSDWELRKTPDGTAVVQDGVTQLTWRVVLDSESAPLPWASAKTFCSDLKETGWRLPTRIELVSILDLSQPAVRADSKFGLKDQTYWTTSLDRHRVGKVVEITSFHWVVSFEQGNTAPVSKKREEGSTAAVICVKGGK